MATISTALRHFKEPTKEQLTQIFFSLPPLEHSEDDGKNGQESSKMDINAVLSLGEAEDSYVSVPCCESERTSLMFSNSTCGIGWKASYHAPISSIFFLG